MIRASRSLVSKLHFFNSVTADGQQIPTYRVLDGAGKLLDGAELPEVCFELLLSLLLSLTLSL